jgi:ADP-ribosylation factor related protein 1
MFSLIFGFYEQLNYKPSQHILVIGLDHAGKSTMLEYMKGQYGKQPSLPPDRITPTVGMNIAKFSYAGSPIMMWDLGGQLKMRSMWERYYDEADGVIFIVDAADPDRFEEARQTYLRVKEDDKLASIPIVIFANKQDKPGAQSVSGLNAEFFMNHGARGQEVAQIFGVSAITGRGIDEALMYLTTQLEYYSN